MPIAVIQTAAPDLVAIAGLLGASGKWITSIAFSGTHSPRATVAAQSSAMTEIIEPSPSPPRVFLGACIIALCKLRGYSSVRMENAVTDAKRQPDPKRHVGAGLRHGRAIERLQSTKRGEGEQMQ